MEVIGNSKNYTLRDNMKMQLNNDVFFSTVGLELLRKSINTAVPLGIKEIYRIHFLTYDHGHATRLAT